MAYRDDLTALSTRQQALATEVADKARELEAASREAAAARARAKLPVFPNIRIATPCTADWASMPGDDKVRACGACNKNVYNLSGMTRDEAETVIVEHGGQLCMRYFQRADGTIILKDCEIGIRQRRRRRVVAAGAAALLATAAGAYAGFAGRAGNGPRPAPTSHQPGVTVAPIGPSQTAVMGGSAASMPEPVPLMGAAPPRLAPTMGHVHVAKPAAKVR